MFKINLTPIAKGTVQDTFCHVALARLISAILSALWLFNKRYYLLFYGCIRVKIPFVYSFDSQSCHATVSYARSGEQSALFLDDNEHGERVVISDFIRYDSAKINGDGIAVDQSIVLL